MALLSINPTTGKEIKAYPEYSQNLVKKILDSSSITQMKWSTTDLKFRLDCLKRISEILMDKKREYALIISEEMGKPLKQAEGEVGKCAWLCEYYFENSKEYLLDKNIDISGQKSFVTFQPIGLVLGVMPWNFPFWQVFRFAIPNVTVGNGAILKHASNVQGSAFAIEACFNDAGFPKNIFRNITVNSKAVADIIDNSKISAVTITGSTPAGRSVAATAGRALKKTVLELGGSDPYIILDDADINIAISSCINGRILNTGQSCIAAKRIIVTQSIHDNFLKNIEQKLSEKIMGDPMDDVDIGPMVSIQARNEVHDQVLSSINDGAILHLGGFIPKSRGAFYPITLLSNVTPGMVAFDEEIFGPVFTIIRAQDEENAIVLGNLTPFGLGAAIFTKDIEKGEEIAKFRLNAGACFVNDFVKSDPRLPFGGIKDSGYGRELAINGMMEFVNVKTVVVKDS